MSLRSYGRAFERTVLRPLFRPFRRRQRAARKRDRLLTELAARVERLESLFREQAGLQYLRLFDGHDSHASAPAAEPEPPVRTRDSA
jgi:hypothetical protein